MTADGHNRHEETKNATTNLFPRPLEACQHGIEAVSKHRVAVANDAPQLHPPRLLLLLGLKRGTRFTPFMHFMPLMPLIEHPKRQ